MKVGDYVRYISVYNNEIKIRKINAIIPPDNLIEENYYKFNYFEGTIKKDIVKSSPNIIDLIEVGDYVNGCPVLYKENNELVCGLLLRYKEENIENIVTKEQFSQMEYEVGE